MARDDAEPASFCASAATTLSRRATTATEKAEDQRNDEQDEEYEEEYLRDFRRTGGNAGESEYRGYQRNDEKDYGIVQHFLAFLLVAEQ